MTIQFYYGRKHQAVMEAAGAVEAVKEVVDYCTEHYGSLSFGTGETLKLIQSGWPAAATPPRGQPAGRGGLHGRQSGQS